MLAISYGTRPELIKLQPVMNELIKLNIPFKRCRVLQHSLSGPYEAYVEIGDHSNNRLSNIVSSCINPSLNGITALLVQGDTSSAYGMALNAFHRGIPIIHLEAGMRTYQRDPFPEEFNRRSISLMADLHLCWTDGDLGNLYQDGIEGHIKVIGSTAIDSIPVFNPIVKIEDKVYEKSTDNNSGRPQVIMTMHRRENWDKLDQWLSEFQLSKVGWNLIFVRHPNPDLKINEEDYPLITFLPPQPREEMLKLISESIVVITDSGGIQEEACFLKRPTVVCREHTERHNQSAVLCNDPKKLPVSIEYAGNSQLEATRNFDYFGIGGSGELAAQHIQKFLLDKSLI